jgi:MFS family permease
MPKKPKKPKKPRRPAGPALVPTDNDPGPSLPAGASGLKSRTFIGLLVAQFFAAFNDQAIHAAAMFFAINTQTLSEENAITMMPILFYAPWVIFCTIAGYFADRYSKRDALLFWKVAEIGITLVATLGFYLGRNGDPSLGSWVVLACVFLMGTHSAFFVPAKYGVMPQILSPQELSRGNGLLESLSFLAVILGTVCGGVLSFLFLRNEVAIGLILTVLAVIGAAASLMIRRVPASNPDRRLPRMIYGPLIKNISGMLAVPALKLVLTGLVFFTFVVAFMRATVYMLGESQNPRWDELKTSAVVGTVALGIGLGSPLAGWLSGKRIDLRLVVIGTVGMIALLLCGAYFIDVLSILTACIIGIGFFTGFYIVPLFTLLQHKAPKGSKGDTVATSNCVNTAGAIAATLLFKVVVVGAHASGLTPAVTDRQVVATGTLTDLQLEQGRAAYVEVTPAAGPPTTFGRKLDPDRPRTVAGVTRRLLHPGRPKDVLEVAGNVPFKGASGVPVDVWRSVVGDVTTFSVVNRGEQPTDAYDNRHLPRFLLLGAAGLTFLNLLLIWRPLQRVRREAFDSESA